MITQAHRVFMEEVVALARKRQMTGVAISFRLNFQATRDSGKNSGQVNASWSEGRHGDKGQIIMRYEESVQFTEGESDVDIA
jgi:hypothetical protein